MKEFNLRTDIRGPYSTDNEMICLTILIINNYFKEKNLHKVDKITESLRKIKKLETETWEYSEVSERRIPVDVEAIILSGSSAHLENGSNKPNYDAEINLIKNVDIPVLGICFGHQLIGKAFGAQLHRFTEIITGFTPMNIVEPNEIFSSWESGSKVKVCQNHIDYLKSNPKDFSTLATSKFCIVEAMKHKIKPIYGVQAHIERATDQHPDGLQILENFIKNVVEKHD